MVNSRKRIPPIRNIGELTEGLFPYTLDTPPTFLGGGNTREGDNLKLEILLVMYLYKLDSLLNIKS